MTKLDNETDRQLVSDFLGGKDAAFEELLKRYLKPVYNFLYQMTNNPSVIDDLTQETFVKVWKNLAKYNPEKSFKTWIFTIARNSAIDYFRKKKTIPFALFENDKGDNKLEDISEDKILPDEILMRKDLGVELDKKLKYLKYFFRL